MNYVLDNNIIDALIKNNESVKAVVQEKILDGDKISIHCIAYYEQKRGLLVLDDKSKLNKFNKLVNRFDVLLLDEVEFFDRASQIWASLHPRSKEVGDADILIGANALEKGFVVVTGNVKDFKRMADVQFENWLRN